MIKKRVSARDAEDYTEENSHFGEKKVVPRVFHLDPAFSTRPSVFNTPCFPLPEILAQAQSTRAINPRAEKTRIRNSTDRENEASKILYLWYFPRRLKQSQQYINKEITIK